jgi:hypothetical protein
LDKFAHADEMIKEKLDRRGRVRELKENFTSDLQRSQMKIASMASPERRRF